MNRTETSCPTRMFTWWVDIGMLCELLVLYFRQEHARALGTLEAGKKSLREIKRGVRGRFTLRVSMSMLMHIFVNDSVIVRVKTEAQLGGSAPRNGKPVKFRNGCLSAEATKPELSQGHTAELPPSEVQLQLGVERVRLESKRAFLCCNMVPDGYSGDDEPHMRRIYHDAANFRRDWRQRICEHATKVRKVKLFRVWAVVNCQGAFRDGYLSIEASSIGLKWKDKTTECWISHPASTRIKACR